MQVIPIASGKGGVGKSLLAANLAVVLAQTGHDVILADLDLGGANLHLMLGQPSVRNGIGVFLKGRSLKLAEHLAKTSYANLSFLPGDTEIPGLANLSLAEKRKLINGLLSLETEFLILDLGAGSNFSVLDFFLLSNRGIVVLMPTISSSLNAYLFLKNVLYRLLLQYIKAKSPASNILKKGLVESGEKNFNFLEIVKKIKDTDPELVKSFEERLARFSPRLVLNLMEDEKDFVFIERLRRSLKEYLKLEAENLGIIYRDVIQDTALNSRIPLVVYKPKSLLARAIYRLADKIIANPEAPDSSPALDFDQSFEIAELEAQIDFKEKVYSVQELMQSGSLTTGDLLDIIRQQYLEIANLKKENQFLKQKLSKAIQEGYKF